MTDALDYFFNALTKVVDASRRVEAMEPEAPAPKKKKKSNRASASLDASCCVKHARRLSPQPAAFAGPSDKKE